MSKSKNSSNKLFSINDDVQDTRENISRKVIESNKSKILI